MNCKYFLFIGILMMAIFGAKSQNCPSIPLPFCENFDSYATDNNSLPPCWVKYKNYDASEHPFTTSFTSFSGTASIAFFSGSQSNHFSVAVLPLVTFQQDTVYFSFQAYAASANVNFEIGIVSDVSQLTNPAAFTPIDTIRLPFANQWNKMLCAIPPTVAAGQRIAIRLRRAAQTVSCYLFLDDFSLETCGIHSVSARNVASTEADLVATCFGNAGVSYEYGPTGFVQGAGTVINGNQSVTLTGLTAETTYEVYATVNCEAGGSCHTEAQTSFTTSSLPIQAAFCENFDGYALNIFPPDWTTTIGYNGYPKVVDVISASPSNALAVVKPMNNPVMFALPYSTLTTMGSYYLSFDCTGNTNAAYFIVGTMTNPADALSFTPFDTVYLTAEVWTQAVLPLTRYAAVNGYLAFELQTTDDGAATAYIDNVAFSALSPVTDLTASLTAHDRVQLTWNSMYSNHTFYVEYGEHGFTPGTGTTLTTTNTSILITDLQDSTTYDFYVSPTSSSPCSFIFFTTASVIPLPYCEDFESYSGYNYLFPSNWQRDTSHYRYNSYIANYQYPYIHDSYYYGTWSKRMRFYTQIPYGYEVRYDTVQSCYAILPEFDMQDYNQIYLSFDLYKTSDDYRYHSSEMVVGTVDSRNGFSGFTPIDTIEYENPEGVPEHIMITLSRQQMEHKYLVFYYYKYNAGDYYAHVGTECYIDNIEITPCYPVVPEVNRVMQTTASVEWETDNVPSVTIEYGVTGFVQGSGTVITSSNPPVSITGLLPETDYTFFFSSRCDTIRKCFMDSVKITTLAQGIVVGDCEDFNYPDSITFPPNWFRIPEQSYYGYKPQLSRPESFSQNRAIYMNYSNSYVSMPDIQLDSCTRIQDLSVSFSTFRMYNYSGGEQIVVGIMEDPLDGGTFTPIDTFVLPLNEWQHYVVPFASYTGEGRFIAFKTEIQYPNSINSSYYNTSTYIDNVCIEQCVVTDLDINYTSDGVSITWEAIGNTSLQIEYGEAGFEAGTGTIVVADTSPYVMHNLASGINYEFLFTPLCDCDYLGLIVDDNGSGDGSGGGGVIVSIPKQGVLPYCQDFDTTAVQFVPSDWSRLTGSRVTYPGVSAQFSHSGNQSLQFNTNSTLLMPTSNMAVLPMFEVPENETVYLTFWLYSNSDLSINPNFYVGTTADPANAASFTSSQTIRLSSSYNWQEFTVAFTAAQLANRMIAFKFAPVNSSYSVFLDDVAINYCNISEVKIMQNGSTATVSWHAMGHPAQIAVEYGVAGFAQGTGTTVTTYANSPLTIDSLSPNLDYEFYLTSRCDTNIGCAMFPYHPYPGVALPYCENFDSRITPTDWQSFSYENGRYVMNYSWYGNFSNLNNNNYGLSFNDNYNNESRYMLLPPFDVNTIQHINFSFDYRRYSYYADSYIIVGVFENDNEVLSFTPVDTFSVNGNDYNWRHAAVNFDSYLGNGRQIAFLAYNVYMDNFFISDCPIGVVQTVASNTVSISWHDNGGNYTHYIEYGAPGFEQGTGTVIATTQNPYLIENLPDTTEYDFYVRCDSLLYTCQPPTTVKTSILQSLPYCEDFESYVYPEFPNNWRRHFSNNTASTDHPPVYRSTSYSPSQNVSNSILYFYYGDENVVLPDFDIDSIQNLYFSFDYYGSYSHTFGYPFLQIGVMEDANDTTTFTPVATFEGYNWWSHASVSFRSYTGRGRFVAIRYLGSWSSLWLDNFAFSTCAGVSAEVRAVSQNSAEVSWINTNAAHTYYIEYGTAGFAQGSGTVIATTQNPYTITGLDADTDYDFYVRCDNAVYGCEKPATLTDFLLPVPYCDDFSYSTHKNQWLGRIECGRFYRYDPLYFETTCSGYLYDNYIIFPELDIDSVNKIILSFDHYYRNYSSWAEDCRDSITQIGVIEDINDMSTFTPVVTLFDTTAWHHETVSLASYTGHGRRIALYNASTYIYYHLDNFVFTTCPVENVTAHTVGHNRVEVGWNNSQLDGYTYYIEYGAHGFAQGTGTIVRTTQCPTVIHNLQDGTNYDFYVRCDSLIPTCQPPATARTTYLQTLPYCENFESYPDRSFPSTWRRYYYYPANYENYYANGSNYVSADAGFNSNMGLRNDNGNAYSCTIFPEFDIDSLNRIKFAFDYRLSDTGAVLQIGVMDYSVGFGTFTPVASFSGNIGQWQHANVSFESYTGEGRFIAIFYSSGTSHQTCNYDLDNFVFSGCGTYNIHFENVNSHSAQITWNDEENPNITIEYGVNGFTPGTGTFLYHCTTPTTLSLNPLTNYTVYVYQSCGDETSFCYTAQTDTLTLFAPAEEIGGCLNFTNLYADFVTPTIGSYSNPYQRIGVVDYGNQSALSRQTVHTDTAERDARTNNLLRTIPEGENMSVRLGNWNAGQEAESVTYSFYVDSTSYDLLILKYAAVLQDPDHLPELQPRFRLELLNADFEVIDANCGVADFIANQALGWNRIVNDGDISNTILWKDWTTIGIDLSDYFGQTIYVRLTTYDCDEGLHYGYAYFTLHCENKRIRTESCGVTESNVFTAPDGFEYSWYTSTNPTPFSTEQSISVVTNSDLTYYCNVSFVDKPSCYFTMQAYAGSRFPVAQFDYSYTISDCEFDVYFENLSIVSENENTLVSTGEDCESAMWYFGNGESANTYNATSHYTQRGTYYVTLIAGIANDQCTDTLVFPIELVSIPDPIAIIGDSNKCVGSSGIQLSSPRRVSYLWNTGDTTASILVNPVNTTTYTLSTLDANGCRDTMQHTVTLRPLPELEILSQDTTLCQSTDTLQLSAYVSYHSSPYTTIWDAVAADYLRNDTCFAKVTIPQNSCSQNNTIYLTITDIYACAVSDSVSYTIFDTVSPVLSDSIPDQNAVGSQCVFVVPDLLDVVRPYIADNCTSNDYLILAQQPRPETVITTDTQVEISVLDRCDNALSVMVNVKIPEPLSLSIIDSAHLLCYGDTSGIISVMAAGGVPSYNYQWNSDNEFVFENQDTSARANLPVGLYTVTVTDANTCRDSVVVSLHYLHTQMLSGTITPPQVICSGEIPDSVFNSGASGGFSSYYEWQQSADSVSFVPASGLRDDRYLTPPALFSTTYYRYVWESDSCGIAISNIIAVQVNPIYNDTLYDHVCQGEPYSDFGFNIPASFTSDTGLVTSQLSLQSCRNCDSTVVLMLSVVPSSSSVLYDTIVQNRLPYSWNRVRFTSAGTLSTVVPNSNGCDSTITMNLTVLPNVYVTLDSTICENQLPLYWNGVSFFRAGMRQAAFILPTGVDSVITMNVHVNRNTRTTLSQTIVENELPYHWNDTTFSAAGTIVRIVPNAVGCDSIITMQLTVLYNIIKRVDSTICENDLPLIWNDSLFTGADTITTRLQAHTGADSLVTMILYINPNTVSTIYDTIVESQLPFTWNDTTFTSAGIITTTISNANGCDSVITMILAVHYNVSATADSTICEKALPFTWNDAVFTEAGTQTTILQAHTGADSLLTMNVTVNQNTAGTLFDTIVENSLPFTWNDTTFADEGSITIIIPNANGCDSMMTMVLHVHHNVSTSIDSTICENALPLSWHDSLFTQAGSKTITYLAQTGADSLVTLNLSVNPNTVSTLYDTIVENELPYTWNDTTFIEEGTITTTIPNANGCDSIVTMILAVHYNVSATTDSTICQNALPFTWNDSIFVEAGTKTTVLHAQTGADSLLTMNLIVHQNTVSTIYDTIVQNALPFTWNDTTFTEEGTITTTISNTAGCDSIVTMILTVYDNVSTSIDSTICENALPLLWNDSLFTQAGVKTITYLAQSGVDSLLIMNLHVNVNTIHTLYDTIVENQLPYQWNGTLFSEAGTISTNLPISNANGCDSIVTMILTVHNNVSVSIDSTICENALPFTWNDSVFVEADTKTTTLLAHTGADSLLTMNLLVNSNTFSTLYDTIVENDLPYQWNDTTFAEEGTITTTISNVNGCDSIITMNLTVHNNVSAAIDSTICVNDLPFTWNGTTFTAAGSQTATLHAHTGADSLLTMNVIVHQNTVSTIHDTIVENSLPFTWNDTTFHTAGAITVIIPNAVGCDSVMTMNLYVHPNVSTSMDSTICENELPITWNAVVFSQAGTQTAQFTNAFGADSLLIMTLSVNPNTTGTIYDTIVENQLPFTWNDTTFTEAGTINTTISNANNCDSVITMVLYVHPNVIANADSTVCENALPLTWNDVVFTEAGTQTATLHAHTGADSLLTMTLLVNPNTVSRLYDTIVENQLPYIWNGIAFVEEDTNTILIPNAAGCDSAITMILTVYNNVSTLIDSSVCVNALPLQWDNDLFASAGTMYDTLLNVFGADSVIVKTLTVNSLPTIAITGITNPICPFNADSVSVTATISSGLQPYQYTWSGDNISSTVGNVAFVNIADTYCGDRRRVGVTVTDANGCSQTDSTILLLQDEMVPTVNAVLAQAAQSDNCIFTVPDVTSLVRARASDNCTPTDSLNITQQPVAGTTITSTTNVTVTVADRCGNQTTTQIAITVQNPLTASITNVTHILCYGDSVGSATATVSGGNSPYTYQWYAATTPATVIATTATISNRPAGTYTVTATDANGCTANAQITLTNQNGQMLPGTIAANQSICYSEHVATLTGTAATGGNNAAYQWQSSSDGTTFTTATVPNNQQNYNPGTATQTRYYRRAWISAACGTTYSNTVLITVWPTYQDTIVDEVCQGHPYQENDFDIAASETASIGLITRTQTLQTAHRCDSIITLLLTVNPTYDYADAVTLCATDLPYYYAPGDTTFELGTPAHSTSYFILHTSEGCDSLISLSLTVNPAYSFNDVVTVCESDLPYYYAPADTTFELGTPALSTSYFNIPTAAGCDSVYQLELTVLDTSLHIVIKGNEFCDDLIATLSATTNLTDFVWSTGETTQEITITTPGPYSVTASEDNCEAAGAYNIAVCPFTLYLPNAITPSNGDGLNDYFCLNDRIQKQIADFEISIYNRWGQLVFKSGDKSFKWHGDYNGETYRTNAYNYFISCTTHEGRKYVFRGSVTVL